VPAGWGVPREEEQETILGYNEDNNVVYYAPADPTLPADWITCLVRDAKITYGGRVIKKLYYNQDQNVYTYKRPHRSAISIMTDVIDARAEQSGLADLSLDPIYVPGGRKARTPKRAPKRARKKREGSEQAHLDTLQRVIDRQTPPPRGACGFRKCWGGGGRKNYSKKQKSKKRNSRRRTKRRRTKKR